MSAAWLLPEGELIIATCRRKKSAGKPVAYLNDDDVPRPAPHSSERGAGSLNISEYYEPIHSMPNMTGSFASWPGARFTKKANHPERPRDLAP